MQQERLYLSFPASASGLGRQLRKALEAAKLAVVTREGLRKDGVENRIKNSTRFLACFASSENGPAAYSTSELALALERLNAVPPDQRWLIPVKLEECELPPVPVGDGEIIGDLSPIDLSIDWDGGVEEILRCFGVKRRAPVAQRSGIKIGKIRAGRDADIEDGTIGEIVSDRDTKTRRVSR